MRKERTLFILGLWIIILPFSGFPTSWKTFLLALTGLAVIYLAYLFYLEVKQALPKVENQSKAFVDNIGSGE